MEGQLSIFDFVGKENEEFKPLEVLALRGTGFRDGMKRIVEYFAENHTMKEKAKFIKNEYGIGGFGSGVVKPCFIHDMDTYKSNGISFAYYDENLNDIHSRCTWEEMAQVITDMINKGKYKGEG